ncbi:MAG: hypothetical protein JWR54_3467 [Mucilaginibacter sp.]|nr:hypothetical protein [Mucilaginibacter sp.]
MLSWNFRMEEIILAEDDLTLATEQTIIGIPGFIASVFHRSMDGTKVTMYAQWESLHLRIFH